MATKLFDEVAIVIKNFNLMIPSINNIYFTIVITHNISRPKEAMGPNFDRFSLLIKNLNTMIKSIRHIDKSASADPKAAWLIKISRWAFVTLSPG